MQTFLIHQKVRAFVNQYSIYQSDEHGSQGTLIGFAQQKLLAFREQFTIYTDESKQAIAFQVQARQVMDFGARYDVRDANGELLGTLGKAFKTSLLRSTWHIFQPGAEDKPLLVVQERSQGLAIARRVWGFLPYIGDLPFFLKYHFDMIDPDNGQLAATYQKTTTLRDHYRLDIHGGGAEAVDVRVVLALGIMLDAMQSR